MTWARRLVLLSIAAFSLLLFPHAARAINCPTYLTQWGSSGTGPGQFASPAGLAADASGNLYVCDVNNHRIQKFGPGGAFITSWGVFGTGNGLFNKPYGVAVDTSTGSVYVADAFNHRIQKFDASGAYLSQWGTTGSGNGAFVTPTGVAVDASGNVYVADFGNHRVQKFNSAGAYVTQWGSFGTAPGQLRSPAELAVGGGFVYVTDSDNHRIQKFTASGAYVAHWGSQGSGDGQFFFPTGVAIDPAGNILVADQSNHRVQRFTAAGVFLCRWGALGTGNGQFINAERVAAGAAGSVYVADQDNHRIQKFEEDCPAYCAQWGESGSGAGDFASPGGLAIASDGDLLACDIDNHRIQKFGTDGAFIAQWGAFGSGSGQFNKPYDVAVEASGSVLVADAFNHRIQRLSAAGAYLAQWGTAGGGNGQFSTPTGVSVDSLGNVYVADFGNHRIQKFNSSGSYLTQWGSNGAATGQFNGPVEVLATGGLVYVVDSANHRIQVFTESGVFVGQWGQNGTGNGQFASPSGIAVDPAGNLLVADQANHRVQRFTAGGAYRCQWGQYGQGDGQFNNAYRVAVDASGRVFVADLDNRRIQRFGCSPAASLGSVPNTALGQAQLDVQGDSLLVLSNIGTSGNDGVSFPAPAPDEGRGIDFAGGIPIDHAIDQGGSMVAEMTGTAAGDPVSLGTITLDVVADGIDITPDFAELEATEVHVEAYLGEERVHSCRVPNGATMHRSSASAAAGPVLAAAGDGIGGVDVGLKKKPGGTITSVTFTTSKTVSVGGTPVVANKLVFSTPTPKQPVAAATAVLKVKRPGTLVTSGTGSVLASVLAFSNLGQVAIRSQAPRPDVGGAPGGGIRVEPKGAAAFAGGGLDSGVTVVGIGSSGNDGVDLALDSSSGTTIHYGDRMGFGPGVPAGAFLEHRVRGKLGCRPDSTVAVVTETVFDDSTTLRPDFSRIAATGAKITILDRDSIVHQAIYPPARTVRLVNLPTMVVKGAGYQILASSNYSSAKSNTTITASGAGSGVRLGVRFKRPAPGSGPQLLSDSMPFDLMIGSTRYNGDEVRFEAVGAVAVTEITGATMRQKNSGSPALDSLRLRRGSLSAGSSGAANTSKGQAHLTAVGGKIVASNIGSSGNDGVRVQSGLPAEWAEVRLGRVKEALQQSGAARMEVTAYGKRTGGAAEQAVLSVKAEKTGAKFRLRPDGTGGLARHTSLEGATAASYRLEVLLGASVVATLDATIPEADFDRMPDRLRHVASGPAFEGFWDTALLISVVGGSSVMGNGIRVRPLGEPDDVETISAMDINSADIPSFEIGDWSLPVFTDVDPAPSPVRARLALGRNPVLGAGALALSITVPSAVWVDLEAFDAQGRRVVSIFRGMQAPGTVSRTWSPGLAAGSGLYFVRMRVGGTTQTEKAVFIR